MANILVPLSGVIAMVGAVSIMIGYWTRVGTVLIWAFLVPVTFMMHPFWRVADPMMRQMQIIMFMKNLSMFGASMFIFYIGPGPLSIDASLAKVPS
jgi:putative oxidoreductase